MIKIFIIILTAYYIAGTLFLPLSDFSFIPNLSQMYLQCKETEDTNMDVLDFVKDHLINIDILFDNHENDHQKPHQPFQFKQVLSQPISYISFGYVIVNISAVVITKYIIIFNTNLPVNISSEILKPPILD